MMKYIAFIDKSENTVSVENKKYSDEEAEIKIAQLNERDDYMFFVSISISEDPTTDEIMKCLMESDLVFNKFVAKHIHALVREISDLKHKIAGEKKPKIKEKILDSSNIHKIRWDKNNLFIHFNNENVYQYFDVPEAVSVEMSESESPGSFLHNEIKGVYRYSKV